MDYQGWARRSSQPQRPGPSPNPGSPPCHVQRPQPEGDSSGLSHYLESTICNAAGWHGPYLRRAPAGTPDSSSLFPSHPTVAEFATGTSSDFKCTAPATHCVLLAPSLPRVQVN
jgi:hypothetical protein